MKQKPMSRICQCDVCDAVEITTQAALPDYWVQLWEYPAVLCENCIDTWTARWEEEPAIWHRGGEEIHLSEERSYDGSNRSEYD